MPNYHYEAADGTSGRIERGVIDAESERNVRQQLRSRGLLPLALTAASKHKTALFGSRSLSQLELARLSRQLSSLLAAGLTLESALGAALEQAESRHQTHILAAVRADIRAGYRFCDALAAHPKDFPAVYRALIEAGEQSGELAHVMERLADYTETQSSLRNKVVTALVYPAIVTVVAVAIVIFLLGHVVPQVVGAFNQTQQELPLLTRMLLVASDLVRAWGMQAALAIGLGGLLWRVMLRRPGIRLAWHGWLLRLPLAGRYIQGVDTERFAATLAILVGSGVPLLAALQASSRTLNNLCLQKAVDETARQVREGSSLASALRSRSVFPPLLVHLIESGERTGRLPVMLERAARTLANELEHKALRMTALLEPLLTLLMGAVVLFIVLAIMLPIIEINQMIQ